MILESSKMSQPLQQIQQLQMHPSEKNSPGPREHWYYTKEELRMTPSVLDGMRVGEEKMHRIIGARFIQKIGAAELNLHHDTVATAIVYFHRFYMYHSFKVFPLYSTAACCLFLAGKVEETPKKSSDIIKVCKNVLDETQYQQFGGDANAKEELLTLERILLQTIRFDLQLEHPYAYLAKYVHNTRVDRECQRILIQAAWTFVNDQFCTTICLQWEPEIVAIAMVYLAGKVKRIDLSDWEHRTGSQQNWWDAYLENVQPELLDSICHQVLDLYDDKKAKQDQHNHH